MVPSEAETPAKETPPVVVVHDQEPPGLAFRHALERFLRDLPGARAVAIGDPSGLPIAALGRGPGAAATPAMETTAMATLALAAAQQVVTSLRLGKTYEVHIHASDALVLVRDLGHGYSLSVVLADDANIGLATLTIERFADELRMILASLV